MNRADYMKKYYKKNEAKLVAYHKNYHLKNRKKLLTKKNKYYQKNKERILRNNDVSRMFQRYGITPKERKEIHRLQDGKCLICKDPVTLMNRNTHIDHDHKTGKVRGLLCIRCNNLLGSARDNIEILQSAIEYLQKNS